MNELYAVLEWKENEIAIASVIATDQSKEFAETLVRIAPAHLYREICKMSELDVIRGIV